MSRPSVVSFGFSFLAALSLLLTACGGGPAGPEKGSPAFYWQAAHETFAAGDYTKTMDHLGQVAKSSNEHTDAALAWNLILTGGLAGGYAEIADSFETGGRANKANPTPFRRQVNDARTKANQLALSYAESAVKFLAQSKDANVKLDFPFPAGTIAAVPQLAKAASGVLPSDAEIADGQKRALARGVILAVSAAAGAGKDSAKASEMFRNGAAEVPRATFFVALAEKLHEQGQLYGKMKLDQPDRVKYFSEQALAALKAAGGAATGSKEGKDLEKRIQASLKAK